MQGDDKAIQQSSKRFSFSALKAVNLHLISGLNLSMFSLYISKAGKSPPRDSFFHVLVPNAINQDTSQLLPHSHAK